MTYPLVLAGTESVTFEVRDKDRKTRRTTVEPEAGNVDDPNALAALLLPALNSEFNWVESFDAGDGRLGLRIVAASNGADAAVRVVGGTNHDTLGLAGPRRFDGVVTQAATNTVRGNGKGTVGEALSLHIAAEAAASGIAVTAANKEQLDALVTDALVTTELGGSDSYMVLFINSMTRLPSSRAVAARGPFNIRVPGAGGYVYQNQVDAAAMIGTGSETWAVWAHELGHNLGMWDVYHHPRHDPLFDRSWDYLTVWSMVADHSGENHADGWHKYRAGWLPEGAITNIGKPAAGATETTRSTLVPLEYRATDYAGVGSVDFPARQLARIELSPEHWLLLENRQPGAAYSQNLPDDDTGRTPPAAEPQEQGPHLPAGGDPQPRLRPGRARPVEQRRPGERQRLPPVIPPVHPDKRQCRYRFNVHAFIRTRDYMLPFGGITIETTPTKASELVLRQAQRTENSDGVPSVAINGLLRGDWPANQQVDAVVVSDADGLTYSGTATTDAGGNFVILVDGVPPGDGGAMLYYFGPNLAPSTLGPVKIKI